MDEGDREVEVDEVGADEGGAVEDADWDDSSEVDAPGHADLVTGIKEGGEAGESLGKNGREKQVP